MGMKLTTVAQLNIPTAGTRVQCSATSIFSPLISISAAHGNTGAVFVGDSSVASNRYSHVLYAGESIVIEGPLVKGNYEDLDLSDLWVDTDTNASKVQISYLARK